MPDRSDEIFLVDSDRLRPLPVRPMRYEMFGKTLEDALQSLLQNCPQIITAEMEPSPQNAKAFFGLYAKEQVTMPQIDESYQSIPRTAKKK